MGEQSMRCEHEGADRLHEYVGTNASIGSGSLIEELNPGLHVWRCKQCGEYHISEETDTV